MLFRSLNKVQLNAPLLLGFIYLACLTVVTTGYVESQISPEDHCSLDNILKNRLENCACKLQFWCNIYTYMVTHQRRHNSILRTERNRLLTKSAEIEKTLQCEFTLATV